jgi:hypothetical protein
MIAFIDLLWLHHNRESTVNAYVYWMCGLGVAHGILVLPVMVLFDGVPCGADCETELCFGESAVCKINKISPFGTYFKLSLALRLKIL